MNKIISLENILKLKVPLVLLLIILLGILASHQITFSSWKELVLFFPLIIFYFNRTRYDELREEGLKINYYTYEFVIFIFMVVSACMLLVKIYFEHFN